MVLLLHVPINVMSIYIQMLSIIRRFSSKVRVRVDSDFYKHPVVKKTEYDVENEKWIKKSKNKNK